MGRAGSLWTATTALCLLIACGACSRRWTFARADLLPRPSTPAASMPDSLPPPPEFPGEAISFDMAAPTPPAEPPPRLVEPTAYRRPDLRSRYQEARCKIWTDYQNYYNWDVARDLLLAVAAGSVLANTSLDQDFRDWYQDDVRSETTRDLAYAFDVFGEGRILLPAFTGLAALSVLCEDFPRDGFFGEFLGRSARGYVVGAPPVIFMQACLGASRPGETRHESAWRPFQDKHAVSGHAFVGAVPFITAAKMTDRPLLKGGLYACSTLTAWARVDLDRHYLSQVCLGWWMAYLACSAVDKTQDDYDQLTLTPVTTPEMVGIGLIYER